VYLWYGTVAVLNRTVLVSTVPEAGPGQVQSNRSGTYPCAIPPHPGNRLLSYENLGRFHDALTTQIRNSVTFFLLLLCYFTISL